MRNDRLLVVAMAAECRRILRDSTQEDGDLPTALHPKHLLWMCENIVAHADDWDTNRLHRWIGFIQAAILANRLMSLETIKRMFDSIKGAHGNDAVDSELIDHLDVNNSFTLELGGQG